MVKKQSARKNTGASAGDAPRLTRDTSKKPEYTSPPPPSLVWKKCSTTDEDLNSLVKQGLLLSQETLEWKSCLNQLCPFENSQEIPLFLSFCERGVGLPISSFFREFLDFYKLQVHHLNPNGILHLSVFVHACETFLGIPPSLRLFQFLYHLKPQPTHVRTEVVGGAGIQFRQGMRAKWFDMPLMDSCGAWKNKWFTIVGNHAMSCPEKDNWYPKDFSNWNIRLSSADAQEVAPLLEQVEKLKRQGLTGVGIAFSFMKRRIQPLEEREHLGFQYTRLLDGSCTTAEDISDELVMVRLNRMFSGLDQIPVVVGELAAPNAPQYVNQPQSPINSEDWEALQKETKDDSEKTPSVEGLTEGAQVAEVLSSNVAQVLDSPARPTVPDVPQSAKRKRTTGQAVRVVPIGDKRVRLDTKLLTEAIPSSGSSKESAATGDSSRTKKIKPLPRISFRPQAAPKPAIPDPVLEKTPAEPKDAPASAEGTTTTEVVVPPTAEPPREEEVVAEEVPATVSEDVLEKPPLQAVASEDVVATAPQEAETTIAQTQETEMPTTSDKAAEVGVTPGETNDQQLIAVDVTAKKPKSDGDRLRGCLKEALALVEIVERPGDAQLRARIEELSRDFEEKCSDLEKVKLEQQKQADFINTQFEALQDIKDRLEGRVTKLARENRDLKGKLKVAEDDTTSWYNLAQRRLDEIAKLQQALEQEHKTREDMDREVVKCCKIIQGKQLEIESLTSARVELEEAVKPIIEMLAPEDPAPTVQSLLDRLRQVPEQLTYYCKSTLKDCVNKLLALFKSHNPAATLDVKYLPAGVSSEQYDAMVVETEQLANEFVDSLEQ